MRYIKSPLNYTGGKYKILDQILPLFPDKIDTFLDLFAGGANVGINVEAKKIILNDNLTFLSNLYAKLQTEKLENLLARIRLIISEYSLSLTNEDGYKKLRHDYNLNKDPILLLVLIFYSFNHQIRFNNQHDFNVPFGKNRSQYNSSIEKNLTNFVTKLHEKNIETKKENFSNYNYSTLGANDFVYCDPPYLITIGTYNDGKRGFTGWGKEQEYDLLNILDKLDSKGIKFALSNVIEHKGLKNNILLNWLETNKQYQLINIQKNYANSSYHLKNRSVDSTQEVLIINYKR